MSEQLPVSRAGYLPFTLAMAAVAASWWAASPLTLRHARKVQKTGKFMVGWLKGLSEWWDPNSQLTEADISPYFWPNGTMPHSDEYDALVAGGFADYRLRIGGLVEAPQVFSLAELKAMPKQQQITTHFCIQGWSGVAKWAASRCATSWTWCGRSRLPGTRCSIRLPTGLMAGAITTCTGSTTCAIT